MSGRSFDMTRKASPPPRKVVVRPAEKVKPKKTTSPRPKTSLRERRARARGRISTLFFILTLIVGGAVVYGFWRPEVRVSEVHAKGVPDEARAVLMAKEVLSGKYIGLLPRDSIFFYPEKELQQTLLDTFPSLSMIRVARDSFTTLSFKGTRRNTAFLWCGESTAHFSLTEEHCYEVDEAGYVFAPVMDTATSSVRNLLHMYGSLGSSTEPVRSTVSGVAYIRNLNELLTGIKELGIPVSAVAIVEDEAELLVNEKTRIKYVLGKEDEALQNAKAGFKGLNLLDGSIEYVDLRFDGKLYVKRYE